MQKDRRIIAAILAADVVEYSRLMAADEPGTLTALKARRAIFDEQVSAFGGREFGSVGDSLMAKFQSAVNAVSAALEIQAHVTEANDALPRERQMMFRIGVTLGDVIEEQSGVFGDAVNVAARLQALAKPGSVMISGPVYDQVRTKVAARYVAAGTRQVKNIAEPVRVFELRPAAPPGVFGKLSAGLSGIASRRVLRGALIGVAIGIALALGLFWRDIPVPTTDRTLGTMLEPELASLRPNSLAVLPFVNLTGDASIDYVGDGLAEELQHRLSRVTGLIVSARRSSSAFKGSNMDVRHIAERLGVSYVVEGTIMRHGDVLRVKAALVDGASGDYRWSDTYESAGDYFAIEEDVGTRVLAQLEQVLDISPRSAPSQLRSGGIAAYDFFLQGLSYLRKPASELTLDAAQQLFERSLAKEPDFARAQAGLCLTYVERYQLDRVPALVADARKACDKARALDANAFEVHEAVGSLSLVTGDAHEAERAFRRALEIVPESPDALIGLASALAESGNLLDAERTHQRAIAAQPRYAASHIEYGRFLFQQGRARDAIGPFERAALLEPDNAGTQNNRGAAYLFSGEFDKAAEAFSRSVTIEPRPSTYSNIGFGYYYRGRFDKAVEMYRKAAELDPADYRVWGNLADALLFSGRPDEAEQAYAHAFELVEGELAVNPKLAVNQAATAYYASRLRKGDRARQCIENALAAGSDDNTVHYYVAVAELTLGDEASAVRHVRRARELGYPDVFLSSAPELREIRDKL